MLGFTWKGQIHHSSQCFYIRVRERLMSWAMVLDN